MPINTIFSGMNIHLPAILMWTTGVLLVLTHCHIYDMDNKSMFETASEVLSAAARAGTPSSLPAAGNFQTPKKTTWRTGKYMWFLW